MKETGDEVPLRHHSAPEKGWRVKLKTAAQASNQSYSFYLFQPQDKNSTVIRRRRTPQEMRKRETGKGFHTTGPAHLSLISVAGILVLANLLSE